MKSLSAQKSILAVAPLFFVLFIDSMGLGLLFPILNSIIVDPATAFLQTHTPPHTRDFLYGLIVGIFMICWFFGAAILGDLSDKIGRKKALLICLIGSFLGYLLAAVAVIMHSLSLLILGRIIAGFTAGSQPIAQAAIIDVSTQEKKARNIGLILLFVSLGFVFGPIFGGVLSDDKIVRWFAFSTPLYFAALLSLLNALLLWLFFKETFPITEKIQIKLYEAINVFISAFKHKGIRWLSLVLFVMIFGWSNYFTFISMFLLHKFKFTPLHVSLFMAALGVGFSIGCGYLVDFCAQRFAYKKTVIVSLFLSAITAYLTAVLVDITYLWGLVVIIGATVAVAYSTLLTMFSDQVSEKEQGWVMGVTGSIMALCFGLVSLLTGAIVSEGVGISMFIAAAVMAMSAIIMMMVKVG